MRMPTNVSGARRLKHVMSMGKAVCQLCDLVWSLTMICGCAWWVFREGHSGWWFVLAIALAGCWSCCKFDGEVAK